MENWISGQRARDTGGKAYSSGFAFLDTLAVAGVAIGGNDGRWRNGRRIGLKNRWAKSPCGFESHPPYNRQEVSAYWHKTSAIGDVLIVKGQL